MSLTGALNGAMSGLAAMAKSASVVSDNIANALTEGYARRDLQLAARTTGGNGGGVSVLSVNRIVDNGLLADRRSVQADAAGAEIASGLLARISTAIGEPGTGDSLSDSLAALESALIESAARPESETGLRKVLDAAGDVASRVNAIGDQIQAGRSEADSAVARDVDFLNAALEDVSALNSDIRRLSARGDHAGGLLDQRQALIDQISRIVPVRELSQRDGSVSLITDGGVSLLDVTPARLSFAPATIVTEHLGIAAGTLSGISVNGRAIDLSRSDHGLAGGTLAASLSVRDQIAPEAQARLDAVARDLAGRFQGADPTIGPSAAGLFTDAGAAAQAGSETGLSRRLAVNALVDPDKDGALWRLRDGVGAAIQGDSGQSALLIRAREALTDLRIPASGSLSSSPRSATGLAADLLSGIATRLLAADTDLARARGREDVLTAQEAQNGVDSDQEMQRLLVIEQAYTANAKVIQAVGAMFDTLLEI